jgi:hypothetical protein
MSSADFSFNCQGRCDLLLPLGNFIKSISYLLTEVMSHRSSEEVDDFSTQNLTLAQDNEYFGSRAILPTVSTKSSG